jgi:tetratricopeptide (TPR) repeat protein
MRKKLAVLFSLVLVTLISTSAISSAQADIEEWTWLPSYIQKDGNRVVYRHGSTASLLVIVENDLPADALMNVSKVIIAFDWGQNKTLDLSANPKQIEHGQKGFFTVSFIADATEAISSEYAHEYVVYVEYVNATGAVVGTLSKNWNAFGPWKFVVFSTDQADALDLSEEYDFYYSAYPSYYFTSVNASQLRGQAVIEASLGDMYYARGEYALAKTQYQMALNLFSQALAAEKEWATRVAEANLNATLTGAAANMTIANARLREADAAMKEADAILNQSYAWILFGLGFVFMGIATIIYAAKKPKTA